MDKSPDELVADLQFGTVKALKLICQQLLEKGALDRELLMADLLQAGRRDG